MGFFFAYVILCFVEMGGHLIGEIVDLARMDRLWDLRVVVKYKFRTLRLLFG